MSHPRARVVILAVHPSRSAATRLRAMQYEPHLAAEGLDLVLWSFFDDRSMALWLGARQGGRVVAALRGLTRLPGLWWSLRRAAVVVVQREAVPFGPPILEFLASWRRALVWDVDDAVWEPYVSPTAGRVPRWLRATGDKFRRLCARADEVWAGSEVLAQWCRQHNDVVEVVPTVVDVPPAAPPASDERVVSWIGSHSTGGFVRQILPALADVVPPPGTVVVGADLDGPPGLPLEVLPWSPANEERTLERTQVGLYPIDTAHPLADGKCGLKAILYMAAGVPCVVTPTITNATVLRDGIEGFHAADLDEWRERVQTLLDDRDLRARMGVAAHARALTQYSLTTWGPIVARRLRVLAERAG